MGTLGETNSDATSTVNMKNSYQTSDSSPRVFFDMTVNGRPLGRVVIKLDDQHLPRTLRKLSIPLHW